MPNNVAVEFTVGRNQPVETEFIINTFPMKVSQLENDLEFQTKNQVDAALATKQDVLTAGEGIAIENNVISATGASIVIDDELSTTSENPVQNKVVTAAINQNHTEIGNIGQTIGTYGNIVTHDTDEFATAAQGALADTALQPNDNISELNNNAGYITSSALSGYATENWVENQGYLTEVPAEYVTDSELTAKGYQTAEDVETAITAKGYTTMSAVEAKGYITNAALVGYATQTWVGQQGYITGINSSDVTTALGYTPYNSSNPSGYQTENQVANSIATETTNRENADISLQNQIDAIVASSDVFDIVGTYAELQAYDISTVPVNDIIKVLVDSTHSNAATYYRCVETGGVKSWSYIGSEGAYYTKGEADSTFVPQTRTVNNKALSSDITLTASDVGADLAGSATTAETNAKNYADSLASNYATSAQGALADTALQPNDNISELQNDVGYITGITSTDVTTALGYTPYDASNPNGYTDNVGTVTSVNNTSPDSNGNVTLSIPAAQVNSDWNAVSGVAQILNKPTIPTVPTNVSAFTNDAGYITNSALTPYVLSSSLATVATTGAYSDLSGTPTIPTVNNPTITIMQGGTTKGSFTLNQATGATIALDAGGGGGGSYTAGDGIIIQNDEISVDGVSPTLSDAEMIEEADIEEISEVTLLDLLATVTGYDATKTQTLKNVNGTLTWVDD